MEMFINRAPCQGDGQWFGVEDIQLLSVYKACQRMHASLKIKK